VLRGHLDGMCDADPPEAGRRPVTGRCSVAPTYTARCPYTWSFPVRPMNESSSTGRAVPPPSFGHNDLGEDVRENCAKPVLAAPARDSVEEASRDSFRRATRPYGPASPSAPARTEPSGPADSGTGLGQAAGRRQADLTRLADGVAEFLRTGLGVLREIRDENNSAVRKIRAAIQRWRDGLSFWERVWWHLGIPRDNRVELGFDPGDL
jgi:hypothetical protein